MTDRSQSAEYIKDETAKDMKGVAPKEEVYREEFLDMKCVEKEDAQKFMTDAAEAVTNEATSSSVPGRGRLPARTRRRSRPGSWTTA